MRILFVIALATLVGLTPPPVLAHDLPLGTDTCSGFAPFNTSCTTGEHTWYGVGHQMTCAFEADYVGSVVNWFEHAGGFRAIRCTRHANGTLTGDQFSSGAPPALLSTITHHCGSFEPGTFTPGGSGSWRCEIRH